MLKEMSMKVDAGLSFKFKSTEPSMSNNSLNLDASLEYEKKTMIKELSELTNIQVRVTCHTTLVWMSILTNCSCRTQNKSFLRVKGRLQLSTYRMRSHQLQVAEEFLAHVKSLPLEYEKGIYYAFLEDYGTHYTKNGKSGGEYEMVYVLNQETIKSKSNPPPHPCLAALRAPHSDGLSLTSFLQIWQRGRFKNASKSASTWNSLLRPSRMERHTPNTTSVMMWRQRFKVWFLPCQSHLWILHPLLSVTSFHMSRHTGDTSGKALVDNVMTSVKGGTLESAVVMRAKLNKEGVMDINTYQDWARTIADAPALINSEVGRMETCRDCISFN